MQPSLDYMITQNQTFTLTQYTEFTVFCTPLVAWLEQYSAHIAKNQEKPVEAIYRSVGRHFVSFCQNIET